MIVPKGFRAREAAALQRSRRGLVAKEIREQRHSVIADKIDESIAAGQDLPPNSAPTLRTEPLKPATETVRTETLVEGDEQTDADDVPAEEVTEKEGAEGAAEKVASDAKAAAKAKPNKKAGK